MASYDLDIQISVFSVQDNIPRPLDNSSFPPIGHVDSPSDIHDFLPLPTPLPINSRKSPDVSDPPASHTTDPSSSHPPPSPAPSVHPSESIFYPTSAGSPDTNPEEYGAISSSGLIAPPTRGASNVGMSRENSGSSSLRRLVPAHSCRSDVPVTPPSPAKTHARSDISRASSLIDFFKLTVRAQKGDHAGVRPGSAEADSNVHPFAFKPHQLVALTDSEGLDTLESLGGVEGLLHGLRTDHLRGLSTELTGRSQRGPPDPAIINAVTPYGAEMTPSTPPTGVAASERLQNAASRGSEDRQRIYGQNILPERPRNCVLLLMWLAPHDKILALLSVAAVASLALGVFLDFCSVRPEVEPSVNWAQGIAIIFAILIVVIVRSLNNRQKEKQIKALNEKKEDRFVKVIRDGGERLIHAHQVFVGDVVLLEPGDIIPCDGVFLSGHNMRCDESNATGESDVIKKFSYEECIALRDKRLTKLDPDGPSGDGELLGHAGCFIFSGSKVLEGVGSYVVIAVGTKGFNGRITMALPRDLENTPLQLKLNDLAEALAKIGSIASGLLFVALLVRSFFETETTNLQRTSGEMGVAFINILNVVMAFMVVALPEGIPLARTLALAFAMKRMRVLGSCDTMASATVICTGKTGTLTQNEMTVVAVTVGVQVEFVRRLEANRERVGSEARSNLNAREFTVDLANLNAVLPRQLQDLFNAAIAINSTAFKDEDPESSAPVFIGNKTESALLGFAKELGWPHYKGTRNSADIIRIVPFSSDRKSMGCVVRLPSGSHRLYVKGASDILTRNCTRHVVVGDAAQSCNEVETAPLGELEEDIISRIITSYASQALRTIALCYRDISSWSPKGARLLGNDEIDYDDLMTNLTLISIIGIEDPIRTGVHEAIAICGKAGVQVKMCTGDHLLTAKSIAQHCGIYTPGGIAMEGPHFRSLSPDVMKAVVPRLHVLARSSPEDKRILVETLKELGDVVGVTGGGTNDGPALKAAHVGFSMSIAGTEVAKEASDIVLMDDNFSSIVGAIMWGRCVNDSVRNFLQFQIAGKVTAVVTTFVWALASSEEEPVLSAVQLLWINLIMDTFAALALATDPASPAQLQRKPNKTTDPLFTVNMTKQILGQAIYQITIILIFHFLGSQILGFHHTDDATLQKHHNDIVRTLVFNVFVFAQIFNSFNCRRLDRKLNVFEGMTENWYFMALTTFEVAVQVLICFFGGPTFDVARIGAREWVISLALGCIPLPLGALIRLIPNEPCDRAFKKLQLLPTHELLPTTRPDAELVNHVRRTTAVLPQGCMPHRSSQVRKRRCAFPESGVACLALAGKPDCQPPSASRSLSCPGFETSKLSVPLLENGFEVHPDTPRDDPVLWIIGHHTSVIGHTMAMDAAPCAALRLV